MLIFSPSSQLPELRETLTLLGLEHQVQAGETEIFVTISTDKSPYSPKEIEEKLSRFGSLKRFHSKTPLLDELPESYAVRIALPGGRSVEFQRDSASPVWIAGPCALDTEEHLRANAKALSALGVRVLRGGAVKPRTSPHDFQGLGREAYRWLADIAHEYGMAAVSEALSEDDVEDAFRYLDIVQVGARNMQNFALLRLLSRGDKPILLKRSPGATLSEWAQAAEYILAGGNRNVILCERGVRGLEKELRYTLDLAGAAWMQQRYKLPVVIDPSHATGTKRLLGPCADAAIAMRFSGLMLETHPKPVEAKSDALQALSLEEFQAIIGRHNH